MSGEGLVRLNSSVRARRSSCACCYLLSPPKGVHDGAPVKVVIFCGGLGVRMGEETQRIPKPMIRIGNRPILWHLMSWYAAWGHREFILCLGYKAEAIKEYFLGYDAMLFNDFVLESDGESTKVELTRPESRRVERSRSQTRA